MLLKLHTLRSILAMTMQKYMLKSVLVRKRTFVSVVISFYSTSHLKFYALYLQTCDDAVIRTISMFIFKVTCEKGKQKCLQYMHGIFDNYVYESISSSFH